MARRTAEDAAREDAGVATETDNAKLEHTEGGATTRDPMDAGVPMIAGQADEPVGPEDALGAGAKRGDYSERLDAGPHMIVETIPEDERRKLAEELAKGTDLTADQFLGDVPRTRLVPAATRTEVGDETGKGGVSTDAARASVA